jgi:hypothetical protein
LGAYGDIAGVLPTQEILPTMLASPTRPNLSPTEEKLYYTAVVQAEELGQVKLCKIVVDDGKENGNPKTLDLEIIVQNHLPIIVENSLQITNVSGYVTIKFDLVDADYDLCNIYVFHKTDNDYFQIRNENLTGDTINVPTDSTNPTKTIVWESTKSFTNTVENIEFKIIAYDGHGKSVPRISTNKITINNGNNTPVPEIYFTGITNSALQLEFSFVNLDSSDDSYYYDIYYGEQEKYYLTTFTSDIPVPTASIARNGLNNTPLRGSLLDYIPVIGWFVKTISFLGNPDPVSGELEPELHYLSAIARTGDYKRVNVTNTIAFVDVTKIEKINDTITLTYKLYDNDSIPYSLSLIKFGGKDSEGNFDVSQTYGGSISGDVNVNPDEQERQIVLENFSSHIPGDLSELKFEIIPQIDGVSGVSFCGSTVVLMRMMMKVYDLNHPETPIVITNNIEDDNSDPEIVASVHYNIDTDCKTSTEDYLGSPRYYGGPRHPYADYLHYNEEGYNEMIAEGKVDDDLVKIEIFLNVIPSIGYFRIYEEVVERKEDSYDLYLPETVLGQTQNYQDNLIHGPSGCIKLWTDQAKGPANELYMPRDTLQTDKLVYRINWSLPDTERLPQVRDIFVEEGNNTYPYKATLFVEGVALHKTKLGFQFYGTTGINPDEVSVTCNVIGADCGRQPHPNATFATFGVSSHDERKILSPYFISEDFNDCEWSILYPNDIKSSQQYLTMLSMNCFGWSIYDKENSGVDIDMSSATYVGLICDDQEQYADDWIDFYGKTGEVTHPSDGRSGDGLILLEDLVNFYDAHGFTSCDRDDSKLFIVVYSKVEKIDPGGNTLGLTHASRRKNINDIPNDTILFTSKIDLERPLIEHKSLAVEGGKYGQPTYFFKIKQ